ncbi:MAG: TetR family transcriptional regulator [Kocuria rhizophila]|nr:TetR family transcriptional regulator [Kocuria rhizophila]
MGGRMDRRIERTRTAVVEAAVALAARGAPAVGMTEIATAAGVSRKAVYENFGSRDEVLRSATEWLLRDAVPSVEPAGTRETTVWVAVLAPVVAHMTSHRDYYRNVLSGPAGAAARDAVVDHAVAGLRAERARRNESGADGVGRVVGGVGTVARDGAVAAVQCRRDRFAVHGLVGLVADALLQRSDADLGGLFRELTEGLSTLAPGR